jgi:hypothetical protein
MTLNNIELWKLLLSAAGLILTTVSGPLLLAMTLQSRALKAEFKLLITELDKSLRLEMAAMEKRLNERIDTRLVHR